MKWMAKAETAMDEKKLKHFFRYAILKSNEMKMQNETAKKICRRCFERKKKYEIALE